ncbi:MAG: MFS transporter [Pseudomonadota bacterium]
MNLSALREPEFRLYFVGAVANVNAMWIVRILISWLAWEATGSASFTGLVAAASLVPTLFGGPVFGVMVDRADIRKAAYTTNLSMIACILALLALYTSGKLSPTMMVVISLAIGTVTAAHHPVRLSLGPRLVPTTEVSSVVALSALNFNVARLISPAVGGVLIEQIGITPSIMVTLTLFLPNLAIIARLHPRKLGNKGAQAFATAMREGLAYIRTRRVIMVILAATCVFSVALRGVLEVLPVVADGAFARGAAGFGQLGSAVGGGALCSALAKALCAGDRAQSQDALSLTNLAIAAIGLATVAILGSSEIWLVALACAATLGATGTWFGVSMQQIIQADLPDDMRGRVMSIWVVVGLGSTALGAWIIGALTELVSLTPAFTAMAVAGAVSLLALSRATHK